MNTSTLMNSLMKTTWKKVSGIALLWAALTAIVCVPESGGNSRTAILACVGLISFVYGLALLAVKRGNPILNRSLSLLGLLVLTLAAAGCSTLGSKEKLSRQEQVLGARNAWYDAYCRGNLAEMDRLETQDFLVISESGVTTKDQQLRGIRKGVEEKNWLPNGTIHVTDDLQVRLHGDCALVTGRGWIKFPGQKVPPKEQSTLSEVWVELDGHWSVVQLHFHAFAPR